MNAADKIEDESGSAPLEMIELDAETVAETPILGYEMAEFPPVGASPGRRARVPQRWMATLASPVKIDIELFGELAPFDELLGNGATTSTRTASVGSELKRWGLDDEQLPGVLRSATPVAGVSVVCRGLRAVVWEDGLIIGTVDPMAKALKLLIANFSEKARRAYVYADRDSLQAAFEVFAPDALKLYVPDAHAYLQQASQERIDESHRLAVERQRRLNNMPRVQVRVVNGEIVITKVNQPPRN